MTSNPMTTRRSFLKITVSSAGGLLLYSALPIPSSANRVIQDNQTSKDVTFRPNVYIDISPNNAVFFSIGKSEMGQGTLTGIAQLLADELECDWTDISIIQADASPEFGFPSNGFMATGGSSGLRSEWDRMRTMGATARIMLQQAAALRWGVKLSSTVAMLGTVIGPDNQSASFGHLAKDAAMLAIPETVELKHSSKRTYIGRSVKRVDTLQKVTGKAQFGIDIKLPDLLTAIVIQAPRIGASVKSFDAGDMRQRNGISDVVQISSGIAIVGDHYWAVHSARDAVAIEWELGELSTLDSQQIKASYDQALNTQGFLAEQKGNVEELPSDSAVTLKVHQPFLAHACMEPMNFTVSITSTGAEVWGPTQAQSAVQRVVAAVAGIEPKSVVVHTTFLGGGFGRRSAMDFVQAAAEISHTIKRPVKLMYSREDDMRSYRYRPYNATLATGLLDAAGRWVGLDVKVAVPSVSTWSGFGFLLREDGLDPQAVEGFINSHYDIPNTRVEWINHDSKVPVHFWRSVGSSHNPFVLETLVDKLASKAQKDPLSFRRALLKKSPRHLHVLNRLASFSEWTTPSQVGVGRGLALTEAFGSIVAEAVEVTMNNGVPQVQSVWCVVDCGLAVNPMQVEMQMRSSIVYGLSAFLRGKITFENGTVEQSNFHDYTPLRMNELPDIFVEIIEGDDKPGGVGEPGLPPLLPAIANAIYALTGEDITELPYENGRS